MKKGNRRSYGDKVRDEIKVRDKIIRDKVMAEEAKINERSFLRQILLNPKNITVRPIQNASTLQDDDQLPVVAGPVNRPDLWTWPYEDKVMADARWEFEAESNKYLRTDEGKEWFLVPKERYFEIVNNYSIGMQTAVLALKPRHFSTAGAARVVLKRWKETGYEQGELMTLCRIFLWVERHVVVGKPDYTPEQLADNVKKLKQKEEGKEI